MTAATTPRTARPAAGAASAPHGDARLRARRVEVQRRAGRRRLRRLVAVTGVALVVVLALVALHSPLFAARDVTVTGASRTGRAAVLRVTGLDRHPPLIDVRPGADEADLRRLPWVARAVVTRSWPSSVHVVVTERVPVAEVPVAPGIYALVDPTGRVLEDTAVRVGALPLVTGVTPTPPGAWLPRRDDALVEVAGDLPEALVPRVARVAGATGGQVELDLVTGQRVELGPPTALSAKMTALTTVLDRVALRGIVTIDLRVPADPVLTF